MTLHNQISQVLTDDRLLANLIALHAFLGLILLVAVVLRRLLAHGSDQLVRWTGLHWLDGVSKGALHRGRSFIFWSTLTLMGITLVGSTVYHLVGQDIRADVQDWYKHITGGQILWACLALIELAILGMVLSLSLRLVRWGGAYVQEHAYGWMIHLGDWGKGESLVDGPDRQTETSKSLNHEETIKHWFYLLERFLLATVVLSAIWCAGHILKLGEIADRGVGFSLRMLAILMVARLLTLACRTLSHTLAGLGNRHLSITQFRRYWERVTRLFPFGERCFEAAVYISAASLCIRELEFIAVVADFGPRLVQCIGIFFLTRVIIELLQVLLNEAFGMYEEDRPVDQKGQTLVPLLQSLCQYVLYFGSGVMMLGVLGVDTRPILAGAGILGLAGGLGAQSLVTDVVSGFFILFENQYLVGDIVTIGDASGRVEAVSIRHTQIRDEHGKLFIIPNGQIKSVINYSKGFVNAVVDIKVPTSSNLENVMADLAQAGKRLRQNRHEVLGETLIKGLIDLSPSEMTIRAVTKVQPGSHHAMQNEFRRLLKGIYDERQTTKVPELVGYKSDE